jgi:hypothetical protein
MKVYKKEFSAKDLLEIANDSRMRTAVTPFGATPGEMQRYIGRSVPWKGVRGIDAVSRINSGVGRGITAARSISMKHHETGTAIVQYPNGEIVTMPMKCYAMMEEVRHLVTLIGGGGAAKRPWIVRRARAAPRTV